MKSITSKLFAGWAVALLLCASGVAGNLQAAEKQVGPFNRIVVLLDASGSYQRRQNEAITKTGELLAALATHKNKRWEKADEITIISLDAIPEKIWKGTPQELAKTGKDEWALRFKARTDYARCTDVTAALELAAEIFESKPQPTAKYLFAFTDFVHEPPVGTPDHCRPPKLPSVPDRDFAWEHFADVSFAAFWMPPSQKMAWDRVLREQGLVSYKLYTTAESAVNTLDIPEPAKRKEISEGERQQNRETLWDWIKAVGGVALGLILLAVLGLGLAAIMRKRRPMAAPNAGARSVTGAVAPMRIPRNPN